MNIIKQGLLTFIFSAFINIFGWAQSSSPSAGVNTLKNTHPRLFAGDARISQIKLQTDKVSKQLVFILKNDAEKRLLAERISYPNDVSNMGTSRNVQGRIISLALAYRVFADKRYLQKAKEELLQLAALKDWGVGHFLDVGEASLAAGIGYDWLYNDLTESERKTIADAVKKNALLPSLQVKEEANSWVNGNFNWNPVCHGGLIVGAIAIAEREPELAKQIIDRGIKNIPIAGNAYSPDGSFAEGPSYWSYGTSFYVLAIEALRTTLGSSAGLEKIPGFLKTADYNNQMVGATGEEYNYSDYHLENLNEPIMLWFARELNRSDLIKAELKDIERLHRQWLNSSVAKSGNNTQQSRHTPLELLWWEPKLATQRKLQKAPLHYTASGLMSIGVMRSAWDDLKATFVAIKGGTPDNSHAHMDAGSFILETNGVRWALDLGTESYDKMRAAKLDLWNYSQNSNRWSTLRVGPEGHNILRMNGGRQLISGNGQVTELKTVNGIIGNKVDLSSLYADKADKVTRTVLLHPGGVVSIQDEWTTKDSAVEVSFQWLTKAQVAKVNNGLVLRQDGRSIQLRIVKTSSIDELVMDVEDVSEAKNVQDSPNPGLKRIVIKTKTAANSTGELFINVFPVRSK